MRRRGKIKSRSEWREKAELKTIFRFTISVHIVANLQRYGQKWYNFGTYTISNGRYFFMFGVANVSNIWHLPHLPHLLRVLLTHHFTISHLSNILSFNIH